VFNKGVPRRHACTQQCCTFLERQVSGQLDDAVLFEHGVFSEHPVDAAAQRAGMRISRRRTADPTLKKASCHAITDFDAGYTGANLDDLPSAIGERHDTRLSRHSVAAQSDCQVAKIERTGRNLDQHLSWAWLWRGKIDFNESVDPRALRQLVGTHFAPRSPGSFGSKLACAHAKGEGRDWTSRYGSSP